MKLWCLILLVALLGCSDKPIPNQRAAKRAALAVEVLARTPKLHTYDVGVAEVSSFVMPISDGYNGAELMRCIVWRDKEFKTATLACPLEPEVTIPATSSGSTAFNP